MAEREYKTGFEITDEQWTIVEPLRISEAHIEQIARRYLVTIKEAGKIHRHIAVKGEAKFITEVSMDETKEPQTHFELSFLLAAVADEGIPAKTIAPKFTGSLFLP